MAHNRSKLAVGPLVSLVPRLRRRTPCIPCVSEFQHPSELAGRGTKEMINAVYLPTCHLYLVARSSL